MNFNNLFMAYNVLNKMANMQFRIKESYQIYKLMKALEPAYQFGQRRGQEMVEKYNGTFLPNGAIQFIHGEDEEARKKGIENMQAFTEEMNELNDTEADCTFEPITLSFDALGNETLSPSDIMALEGIINFE